MVFACVYTHTPASVTVKVRSVFFMWTLSSAPSIKPSAVVGANEIAVTPTRCARSIVVVESAQAARVQVG